jgi:hypothetical protein
MPLWTVDFCAAAIRATEVATIWTSDRHLLVGEVATCRRSRPRLNFLMSDLESRIWRVLREALAILGANRPWTFGASCVCGKLGCRVASHEGVKYRLEIWCDIDNETA